MAVDRDHLILRVEVDDELITEDGQALIDLRQAHMRPAQLLVGFIAQELQFLCDAAQFEEGAIFIQEAARHRDGLPSSAAVG